MRIHTSLLLLSLTASTHSLNYNEEKHCYEDFLVALSPDTEQTNWPNLKDGIESWLVAGSRLLHTATHGWAYICNVKVLLPASWSKLNNTETAFSEVHKDASVWVEGWNSIHGSAPFTLQPGGCGEEGLYIQVSQDYLRYHAQDFSDVFGPPGQVFLHEWAKLRYGVFEEHGYPGDPLYPAFYYKQTWTANGPEVNLKPAFCTSQEVEGSSVDIRNGGACKNDPTTGLPDQYCIFQVTGPSNLDSSVMGVPYLKGNDHFCEEGEILYHHPNLPNRHNAMCGGKSVFEVVRQHPDFIGYTNQTILNNTIPTFTYLQPKSRQKYVMVLDVSGSMCRSDIVCYDRINRLKKAASRFIRYDIENGTPLGVVKFSTRPLTEIIYPVTEIKDTNRNVSIDIINKLSAGGGTCLGDGLMKGLDALKAYKGEDGGVMIFLTDGKFECTGGLGISEVIDDIVAQNVRVVTIAFGKAADYDIETLAERTNGAAYFVPDNSGPGPINEAFSGSLQFQPEGPTVEKSIVMLEETIKNSKYFNRTVTIDQFSGRDAILQVDLSSTKSGPIEILFGSHSWTIDTDTDVFKHKFSTQLETGDYYMYFNSTKVLDAVTVKIESKAPNITLPLSTTCWSSLGEKDLDLQAGDKMAIFAKVSQGQNPVIKASVIAVVDDGDAGTPAVELELLDNGAGPDKVANDGIYARYFTQFTESKDPARYTLKCDVTGTEKSSTNQGKPASRSLPSFPTAENPLCCGSSALNDDSILAPTGKFLRAQPGGLISVLPTGSLDNIYPPGNIRDLSIAGMDFDRKVFNLSFTFPGADLDQGMIAEYFIFYSVNLTSISSNADLKNSSDIMQLTPDKLDCGNCSSLPSPLEAGEKLEVVIKMLNFPTDTQLYWRVRVEDDANATISKSTQSNVAWSYLVDTRSSSAASAIESSVMFIFSAVIWSLINGQLGI